MKDDHRRILVDRRKKPTPGLSRYIFFGRRKEFRRRNDQQKGGYVDRYSLSLLIILMAILFLNFADAILTMVVLDHGGEELNPVVGSAIEAFGTNFWIWKFCIVSFSLILLCIHSKFRRVKGIILAAGSIYLLVVIYQLLLITHWLSATLKQARHDHALTDFFLS